jgi:peptidyl-prolyl cis-trans isomerase C
MRVRRLARSPLLHCLGLGLVAAWLLAANAPPGTIRLDPAQLAELERGWQRQTGRLPSAPEMAVLIEEKAADEALYREALARHLDELPVVKDRLARLGGFLGLADAAASPEERRRAAVAAGLDRSDLLVRRYLIGAVREKLAAEVEVAEPSRREVAAYHRAHRDAYRLPPRVRLSHVYVGGLDSIAEVRALALAESFRAGTPALDTAVKAGDAFYAGHHLPALDRREIAARFGSEFAAAVEDLQAGSWSEPVRSSYGYHLIWIRERRAGRELPLDQVEEEIVSKMLKRRREAALRERILTLRKRYSVELPPRAEL